MRYLPKSALLIAALIAGQLCAQKDLQVIDSTDSKRFWAVNTTLAGATLGSHIALYFVWYRQEELGPFHLFNDCSNWLQMDKAGHGFTAYHINRISNDMYRWSGQPIKRSILAGFGVSMTYLGLLEVMDGFSSGWGFSGCDVLANLSGSALFSGQELLFHRQLFVPKFSFSRSPYAGYRPEVLGSNYAEQLLKDYNGQTYWLSFSPFSFIKELDFLDWLCLSVGYSADQKLVGDASTFHYIFNGMSQTFNASRQWVFSMDIDLSRIPVKKPWLRKTLKQLNVLKIPFPALSMNASKHQFHWIYF